MKSKLMIMLISIGLFALLFAGCAATVPEEVEVYITEFGDLTASWSGGDPTNQIADNILRIENQSNAQITSVEYSVGTNEPDWTSIDNLIVSSSSLITEIADNDYENFDIGSGSTINTGVNLSATIWILAICSNGRYMVGSFYWDTTAGRNLDEWWVTIYEKQD